MDVECTFQISSWDEKPINESEGGAKLTRAIVSQSYEGSLTGEGNVEFLIAHAPDKTATFVGMEKVFGVLSGKKGSFIIQHGGTFDRRGASSSLAIASGSGTGDLEGIQGTGHYSAQGKTVTMFLSYELSEKV